jgi:hypothetical protein
MAQHANYWSCSKFANWIRGTAKPGSETAAGWRDWKKAAKAAHPFRYWLADTGLGKLQDFVTWPTRTIYDIKCYYRNRWIDRTNSLTAHPKDIRPGDWRDVGSRILPCLFNELQNFVEVELAHSHVAWMDKDDPGYMEFNERSAKAGLAHLDWAASLKYDDEWIKKDHPDYGKPTPQALRAIEIKALYEWWTVTYRNRAHPHELSGWSALCDSRRAAGDDIMSFLADDKTPEEQAESRRILDLCLVIEKQQTDEDTDMMIRLIRVRDGLWS